MVTFELQNSLAYRSLTPTAKLVLIDMIGYAYKRSNGSKEPLPGGFEYTFAVCREPCSENAFNAAKRLCLERGFIEMPPQLQPLAVARPAVYVPSQKWRKWSDAVAAESLGRKAKTKSSRIVRDQKKRTALYVGKSGKSNTAETGTKKSGDTARKKGGDSTGENPSLGTKKGGDTLPDSGPVQHQEVRGIKNSPSIPPPILPFSAKPPIRAGVSTLPIRDAATPVPVGALAMQVAAAVGTSGTPRPADTLLDRLVRANDRGDSWRGWFRELIAKLEPCSGLGPVLEALEKVESCADPLERQVKDMGELQAPGRYLVKQCCEACKARRLVWPCFPNDIDKSGKI